jgi:hypothetical protein
MDFQQWHKSHLDAYLAMAEVILEQNVDPGWVQFFLVPILEWYGTRGGIWYHNSVKINIYNNSVFPPWRWRYVNLWIYFTVCESYNHLPLSLCSSNDAEGENSDFANVINMAAVEYTARCNEWPIYPSGSTFGWVDIVSDLMNQQCSFMFCFWHLTCLGNIPFPAGHDRGCLGRILPIWWE